MGIHQGHRARRRQLFLEHGLEPFADHEVLELLMFYAIPQKDTNPIAHRLLKRFGSLEGVLSASVEELKEVEGVGESAAILLELVPLINRRAALDSMNRTAILQTTQSRGAYCMALLSRYREEAVYLICLDAKCKVLSCALLASGPSSAAFSIREVANCALRSNATSVILTHHHPSGLALPSRDDLAVTARVEEVLWGIDVRLADHIIVADNDFVSLWENGNITERGMFR